MHLDDFISAKNDVVHIIVVGTKPDIIKQAPLYHELVNRGELVFALHTGQHYDYNNSRAVTKELGFSDVLNLNAMGASLTDRFADIVRKVGEIAAKCRAASKIVIPYIHGDTLTAASAALGFSYAGIKPVHVEAGLRTMSLKSCLLDEFVSQSRSGLFDFSFYVSALRQEENYVIDSEEPYPEQMDTRVVSSVASVHFAPCEINRNFLLLENISSENIVVVGNTINAAVKHAMKHPVSLDGTIFSDCFDRIFFSIHRRETCTTPLRFKVVMDTIELLIANGESLLVIGHPMFLRALASEGAHVEDLQKRYGNKILVVNPIAKHSTTISIMRACKAILTDSGGIQEEAHMLGKKCFTMRFGTDRPETVLGNGNILVPPVDASFCAEVVKHALATPSLDPERQLYAQDAPRLIAEHMMSRLYTNRPKSRISNKGK